MLSFLKKILGAIANRYLPMQTKRMIVLASISAIISPIMMEKDREKFMHLLNQDMNLAKQQDSIGFAIELGKIMWKDLKQKYHENYIDNLVLAEAILNECPDSLTYSDEKTMRKDILSALELVNRYAYT